MCLKSEKLTYWPVCLSSPSVLGEQLQAACLLCLNVISVLKRQKKRKWRFRRYYSLPKISFISRKENKKLVMVLCLSGCKKARLPRMYKDNVNLCVKWNESHIGASIYNSVDHSVLTVRRFCIPQHFLIFKLAKQNLAVFWSILTGMGLE